MALYASIYSLFAFVVFSLFTVGTFLLSGLNIMALPVSHGMRRAVEDLWGSGSGNIGSVCHVTFTSLKLSL